MERRSFELSFGNLNIIFTFPGCERLRGVCMQLSKHSTSSGTGNAAPNSYALCIQMCAGGVTFDGSTLSLRTAY